LYKYKENLLTEFNFRPFDTRYTLYTFYSGESNGFIGTPSKTIKDYYTNNNLTLITKKQMQGNSFANIFITNEIVDRSFLESLCGGVYAMPLYLYHDNGAFGIAKKKLNFTVEFSEFLKTLNFKPIPEKILAYIYAVLHSPIYRKKYIEILKKIKNLFPAVPFTTDKS